MDLSWHAFVFRIQVKTPCHGEKSGFGYLWLSKRKKKSQTHPLKPTEAEPSFRKVNLFPTKLGVFFPTHFKVRATNLLPGLRPTVQNFS